MLRLVSKNNELDLQVTLMDMARHLKREDTEEDDAYIEGCLLAATEWAEQFTGLVLADQTFDLFVDAFPSSGIIVLGRGPLLSLESVNYRNVSGTEVELSSGSYLVDYAAGTVYLPANTPWPDTDGALNAVRIRFRAGYIDEASSPGTNSTIPEPIKQAIKIYAATLYANREDDPRQANPSRVPYGSELMLRPYRIIDSLA